MLAISALLAASGHAQIRSNVGREFYIGFGSNSGADESSNLMALYITSTVPTSGRVDIPALNFIEQFNATPGRITTIVLPSDRTSSTVEMLNSESSYSGLGVHVTADQDISLFGMNHKTYSSDAFMAMPVSVLGDEYRALCYPSSADVGFATAGEFWFVATEDNTTVTITPTSPTMAGMPAGLPFTVRLDHGDAYLVKGDPTDPTNDLTGSFVSSDRPISFFSGHERTQIPIQALNIAGSTSRDHLCEQLPSLNAWGDSVIVVPFSTSARPDLVRVLAAIDSTEIRINDSAVARIDAGQYFDLSNVSKPTLISASAPILVGQYMHTSWGVLGDASSPPYGDPALAIVLPVEQFSKSYTISSIENPTAFSANFANIVVAGGELPPDVYLDDTLIPRSTFQAINGSSYKYIQQRITQGTHTLHSDLPFGLTVYALGEYDSYAYTGGALVKYLNPLTVSAPTPWGSSGISELRASSDPFSHSTNLTYALKRTMGMRFELVDELGRVVRSEALPRAVAGTNVITLSGAGLLPGSYFAILIGADGSRAIYALSKRG